jgi:hypothetical protein
MIPSLLGLLSTVAVAGPPKSFTVVDDDRVPVVASVPGSVAELAAHALCVRYRDAGAAELVACPQADALFAGSRAGLATELPTPPSAPDVTGLVRAGTIGQGGWVAVDAHLTSVWRYSRAPVGELDAAAVSSLATWCANRPEEMLAVELFAGCQRTVQLGDLPVGSAVRTKDLSARFVGSDTGAFLGEGASAGSCSATPAVVLARTLSKAQICSGEVFPVALEGARSQLASFKASPDAVDAPVRALFGDLAASEAALEDLRVRMVAEDAQLAQAGVDLAAVRASVAAISAADTRFVSLLTRLDSIEADIGETVVASASIQERIAALSTEEAGLAEKALAPGMDGMLVMRLGAQLDDLNTRVESLRAEAAQLEARVAAARQGIGYLQGGLLALQPEASAAPKGR